MAFSYVGRRHVVSDMYLGCSLCVLCRIMRWYRYNEMTVGDIGDCSGNVMNGPGMYLRDGLLMDMMKTWMRTRPTPRMKHDWICRNIWWQIVLFNDQQDDDYGRISDDDSVMMTWPYMLMTAERENTFLVKMECCCIGNFGRYYDVYYHYMLLYPHHRCVSILLGFHYCVCSLGYNLCCNLGK